MVTDGDKLTDKGGNDTFDGILEFVASLRALGVSNFEGKGLKLSLITEPVQVSSPAGNEEEEYDNLLYSDPDAYYQRQIEELKPEEISPDADET